MNLLDQPTFGFIIGHGRAPSFLIDEMQAWCHHNCRDEWGSYEEPHEFYFKSKSDAALFRLFYGDYAHYCKEDDVE